VDGERGLADAILVGAGTLRRDDPRLLVRSAARRAERGADPIKVAIGGAGDLDPSLRFFTTGHGERLVYCPAWAVDRLRERLGAAAEVVGAGEPLDLRAVLDDLGRRGVRRLLVEGGSAVHTAFLSAGLADELQLAVAPFFVGEARAPRFVRDGAFPHDAAHRMTLAEVRPVGDVAVLRYVLSQRARDDHWLRAAIELSRRCPPSSSAFSVGAVIVGPDGAAIAEGWSRESDPVVHAEESALAKATGDPRLREATIYSSLEPCGRRRSRPRPCAELVAAAGIPRVVFAMREPAVFVDGRGAEALRAAGVEVVELPELAAAAREVNAHLPLDG
jgi:riboflavin biosynthesis pyrimidine reductase/pyrimidine deaminase RibD-like protein